jgi:hypothetical protein
MDVFVGAKKRVNSIYTPQTTIRKEEEELQRTHAPVRDPF